MEKEKKPNPNEASGSHKAVLLDNFLDSVNGKCGKMTRCCILLLMLDTILDEAIISWL